MKPKYLLLLLALASCTVSKRLQYSDATVGVRQPPKTATRTPSDALPPLKIQYQGDSIYLVETEKVDGDTLMTLQAMTVNVVSEIRNVAERNGTIKLDFRIVIPQSLLGTTREIILRPTLLVGKEKRLFDPISLRGRTMDILQSREYWQLYKYHLRHKNSTATERFLHFPYEADTRLDSVFERRNETVLHYSETISSENLPRRLSLTVPGEVRSMDESIYPIPERDTVGYVISSMTSFIDTTVRHRIKIVERNVAIEEKSRIVFPAGRHNLIDTLGDNKKEIGKIVELQEKVRSIPDLELDSILITATASPEGSYKNNTSLSEKRGKAVADSLFQEFHPNVVSNPENWKDLEDSIRNQKFVHRNDMLSVISSNPDPDLRETALRTRFPREYQHLRKTVYPALRIVSVRYCMHRKGMLKDTIHLQETDTLYMNAVRDLRQRRYSKALSVLSSYQDRNTAIALMSLGYDRQALKIVSHEEESDTKEYLLAILCSRLGMTVDARAHFLRSCLLNSQMEFRGNLDPEISKILKQ